jgi:hypothetical protein
MYHIDFLFKSDIRFFTIGFVIEEPAILQKYFYTISTSQAHCGSHSGMLLTSIMFTAGTGFMVSYYKR